MSTDEQYKPIEFREKYVCSDQDEIGWALGKVQQYAKEHDLVMYVIRKNGFYYMTDEYKSVGKRVAIVYPGGRTEIGNTYEAKRGMMPNNELEIGASYEVLQRYTCKNRVTKAKIKMVRIKYLVNGKDVGRGVYLTCLDHNETRRCQNKTEALYQMRQPWVWCDGCAQIHFHTEWQNQLHHGVEDKNYD